MVVFVVMFVRHSGIPRNGVREMFATRRSVRNSVRESARKNDLLY